MSHLPPHTHRRLDATGPLALSSSDVLGPNAQAAPRFANTYCSQCGAEFGPGNSGFSHCKDHQAVPMQGGMTNDQVQAAWDRKLSGTAPKAQEMAAFAVGIEAGFERARELELADWMRLHYVLKKHGVHPGRTDDHLADVVDKALSAPRWWHCPTHGAAKANAWGCPECVREMRGEIARLVRERDDQRAKLLPLLALAQEVLLIDANGATPDGDGVNGPTALWAEDWKRRLAGVAGPNDLAELETTR